MSSIEGGGKKIGFSLASNKKGKKKGSTKAAATAVAFGDPEEDQTIHDNETINNDIPKNPLVIPCKQDSRQSLQEQARAKRKSTTTTRNEQPDVVHSNDGPTSSVPKSESKDDSNSTPVVVKTEETTSGSATVPADTTASSSTIKSSSNEDQAAIKALEREAAVAQGKGVDWNGADDNTNDGTNKRVIAGNGDTFQRGGKVDDDQKKFEADIEELPQDISVKSQVYKSVPISEFGAAMLRGMGWNGNNNNNGTNSNRNKKNQASDATTMPRPSRLGLGATPKIMGSGDLPDTHSRRRPRRHDQVQREERLKQQQEEMEKERQRQLSLDKQRVVQLGSIVYALQEGRRTRAVLKKLTGVPGLNMILVHYEGDATSTKVKKGSIELVPRTDLNERPYRHAAEEEEAPPRKRSRSSEENNTAPKRTTKKADDRNHRDSERTDRDDRRSTDRERDTIDDDRRRERKRDRDRDRDRDRRYSDRDDRDRDRDRDRHKRKRDDERRRDDEKRHRSRQSSSSAADSSSSSSWLIPNIRVRVISSRYGDTAYKQKGVVVDVTRKGVATLTMGNGQVINVAERHLETALPKVGGSSIVLSGTHRFSKGRLLERDSKKNRGAIQVYEDMSIVTTSLDDMAEWCGPLDDDLEH